MASLSEEYEDSYPDSPAMVSDASAIREYARKAEEELLDRRKMPWWRWAGNFEEERSKAKRKKKNSTTNTTNSAAPQERQQQAIQLHPSTVSHRRHQGIPMYLQR